MWRRKTDGRREAGRSRDEGTGEWWLLMVFKVRGSDTGSVSGPLLENTNKLKSELSESQLMRCHFEKDEKSNCTLILKRYTQ